MGKDYITPNLGQNSLIGVINYGYVKVPGSTKIDDLTNVEINNPENNDILLYNKGTQKWENSEFPVSAEVDEEGTLSIDIKIHK